MAKDNNKVGRVTHYYTSLGVGIVKLSGELKAGDRVRFQGHTTDFEQPVDSLEYDRKEVKSGKKGEEVGIKVDQRVREGDEVFKI